MATLDRSPADGTTNTKLAWETPLVTTLDAPDIETGFILPILEALNIIGTPTTPTS